MTGLKILFVIRETRNSTQTEEKLLSYLESRKIRGSLRAESRASASAAFISQVKHISGNKKR